MFRKKSNMPAPLINNKTIRKIKTFCRIIIISLIIFTLLFIITRNVLLNYALSGKNSQFNKSNPALINYEKAKFKGLNTIIITNLTIASSANKDSLLYIDNIQLKIKLYSLFLSKIHINSIKIKEFNLHLINKKDYDNYSYLSRRNQTKNKSSLSEVNRNNKDYYNRFANFFSLIFNEIPDLFIIDNLKIRKESDIDIINISTKSLKFEKGQLTVELNINENKEKDTVLLNGTIDKHKKKFNFILEPKHKPYFSVPFIQANFATTLKIDHFEISLEISEQKDIIKCKGLLAFNKLRLSNSRISDKEVILNNLGFRYNINIGTDFIELDSSSGVIYNKLLFNPFIKYKQRGIDKELWLKVEKNNFNASLLFESLPEGLFNNLKGLKTKGELSYKLNFYCNFSKPDSLKFSSALKKHNFSIERFGQSDFTRINDSFIYTAYEKGQAVSSFEVGPANVYFTPFNSIPDLLIKSILTSEDAFFFYHKGFNEDAFRESIVKNIKEKRFARGGSTITMQLVKNVFLNRNKNITRKVEEALIVWLIENNNLVSKERMMEVYLNIIEWGPGIYGIGQAARFYFNKKPSQLNLDECLYLANLIPHPKWFRYSLDENMHLKQYVIDYIKFVADRMLLKEKITQAEYEKLNYDIKLTGPAHNMLLQENKNSIFIPDSLFIDNDY